MPIQVHFGIGGHDDTVKNANNGNVNGRSPSPAPPPPEPLPPKVKAFFDYDEDSRLVNRPWRYAESPNEEALREQMEANGCWAGI